MSEILLDIWEEGLKGVKVTNDDGNVIIIREHKSFEAVKMMAAKAIMKYLSEGSKTAADSYAKFKERLYEFLVYKKIDSPYLNFSITGGLGIFKPYINRIKLDQSHKNKFKDWIKFTEVIKMRSFERRQGGRSIQTSKYFANDKVAMSQRDTIHKLRRSLVDIFNGYKDKTGIKIILVKPTSDGFNLAYGSQIGKFIPQTSTQLPITFDKLISWDDSDEYYGEVVGVDVTDIEQLKDDILWAQLAAAIFVEQCTIIIRGVDMAPNEVLAVYDPQVGIVDPKEIGVGSPHGTKRFGPKKGEYYYYNGNDKYVKMIKEAFKSYNRVLYVSSKNFLPNFEAWIRLLREKVGL